MLEVRDLEAGYHGVTVLHGVSLHVDAGEMVAVVGANGAGKSTLIKVISGLHRQNRGDVRFAGHSLRGLRPDEIVEMGLLQVPEGRRLFSRLSVLDNLIVGNSVRRARAKRQALLDKVFDMFPILARRSDQFAGTLSGGEQQMLAMGRAIMGDPVMLMCDEPSLGLAPAFTASLFEKLKALNDEGMAVVLVEQKVSLALQTCERGYVIEDGVVALTDTTDRLRNNDRVREAYLGL